MKVAVYSGSFNPLHIGHLSIIQALTGQFGFDMVYLIVSPQNPFKDAGNVKTGEQRYHAACEAVMRHPELKVKVDDIELSMTPPHYTIRTLDALREREPMNEFSLVIGGDNLIRFNGWKDYRRILLEYGITVFPRKGYAYRKACSALLDECPEYRISLVKAPFCTVSSTEIRDALAKGEDVSSLIM